MKTILLLAAVQAFFLSLLLFSKKKHHLSDHILGVWLSLIGVHTFISFCFLQFQFQNAFVINVNSAFPFLQGPFLYFYVDSLTSGRSRLKRSYIFHFIPFLIFVGYQIFILNSILSSSKGKPVVIHLFSLPGIFNTALLISVPIYIIISLVLLKKYRERILDNFSTIDKINLNWLRYLIAALGVVWIIIIIGFLQTRITGSTHLIFVAITLFVYTVGYFGFKQTTLFSNVHFHEEKSSKSKPTQIDHFQNETPQMEVLKYQKSGLKKNEAHQSLERLLKFMDTERPYLDDQLTLSNLADKLNLSVNHLSQIINEQCRQNFFDFVNSYRVEAFKQKLQTPGSEMYSLFAIALECGFGSKSSFNRIFKNITGHTPTQYKKSIKIS